MKQFIRLGQWVGGLSVVLSACTGPHLPTPSSVSIVLPDTINQQLQYSDHTRLQQLLATAPAQHTSYWQNPDRGTHFTFISHAIFVNAQGKPCRRYHVKLDYGINKQIIPIQTVCRQPDGQWTISSHLAPPNAHEATAPQEDQASVS